MPRPRRFSPRRVSTRPHGSRLSLEPLEERALLSATLVRDIVPITGPGGDPSNLIDVNGILYFTIQDRTPSDADTVTELWRSDGTAAGTVHIADFQAEYYGVGPMNLTNVNGNVYFTIERISDMALWKTDGTPAGTGPIAEDQYIGPIMAFDGALYFGAVGTWDHPAPSLWRTDGTAAGPTLIADVQIFAGPVVVNGKMLFGDQGGQLWASDGTPAGTGIVTKVTPLYPGTFFRNFTAVGNELFFTAQDATGNDGLWVSDGTPAGTVRLQQGGTYSGDYMADVNNQLFFFRSSPTGSALWKSDGTPSGTTIVTGLDFHDPTNLSMVGSGGELFYLHGSDGGPFQSWKTDGTATGTVRVATLPSVARQPSNLTDFNGTLFFTASDPGGGIELWKSDGTAAGTELVMDLPDANYVQLADVHGTVYFADGSAKDVRLFKYDPAAGPTAVTGGPYTIYAGAPVTLNGLASSGTGPLTFAWTVNGHSVQGSAGLDVISPAALASYGITGPGSYPITLTVTDGTASSTSAWAYLILQYSHLNVTGSAGAATEGEAFHGTLAIFTDPVGAQPASTYTAQVDWGDGSTSAGTVVATPQGFVVAGAHTYAEEGTYTVTVNVTKGGGQPNTAMATIKVADAPTWAGRVYQRTTEGQTFTGTVATITDGSPLGKVSDFTATIQWGDGTTTNGTVTQTGPGKFAVHGGHTYAAAGTYTVTVTARDAGGATSTAKSTLLVDDAPLTAVLPKTLATVSPPASQTVVAGFTDANPLATAGQFTATIDWGDGTTSTGTVSRAPGQPFFIVTGKHAYAKSGTYKVITTIHDAGGRNLTTTSTLPVVVPGPGASQKK
jgi:ELWxxDGT repeat protein